MLEILNLMVHQSLGNLREKKNLICSSVTWERREEQQHANVDYSLDHNLLAVNTWRNQTRLSKLVEYQYAKWESIPLTFHITFHHRSSSQNFVLFRFIF